MWRRIQAWCFGATRAYQLGIFRPLLTLWIAHDYLVRVFPRLREIAGRSPEFLDPPLLARALGGLGLPIPPAAGQLSLLGALAIVLTTAALIGVLTRPALIGLAALNLYFGAAVHAWGYAAHSAALPALVLVVIAFAPGVESFSLDAWLAARRARRRGQPPRESAAISAWPVRLTLLLLCLFYFASGVAKLRHAGPAWADGRTLAFYLSGGSRLGGGEPQRFIADPAAPASEKWRDGAGLVDYAYLGRPTALGLATSRSATTTRLIALGTLLFELSFPLALLGRRLLFGYLLAGALFHLGIIATLRIEFWSYLVVYLLFVDWLALADWLKRRVRRLPRAA
jgi:uncharacterized membrane protein YphA (DoxX/SURF4 family)